MFYLRGMRGRSIRSVTELAREIQLADWSTAGNLSNRSAGVQIPRDICIRFGRYLYSAKCSWIINLDIECMRAETRKCEQSRWVIYFLYFQIKQMFQGGKLKAGDKKAIKEFSEKYIVSE